MARGRRPKPTALKVLEGNPGRRKLNDEEPDYGSDAPAKPDWLDDCASEEWDRLVELLVPARVLTKGEGGALLMACDAFSRWRRCTKFLEEQKSEHYTLTTEGGTVHKQFVEVGQRNVAWRNYLSALTELGLTPSSRSKVKAVPAKSESGLKRLLG